MKIRSGCNEPERINADLAFLAGIVPLEKSFSRFSTPYEF